MKKAFVLFLFAFTTLFAHAQVRENRLLNENWNFSFGYEVKANAVQRVNLPHTWNNIDAPNGNNAYYRGEGIYEKKLFIPANYQGKRVYLKFDGANSNAHLFVNGNYIGSHKGGYTAFVLELTKNLKYGQDNNLQVRVTNAFDIGVMPLLGDFNFYGGIYRDVHLIVTEKSSISLADYGSSGVYLTQKKVSKESADVAAKILVSNGDETTRNYEVKLEVFQGDKLVLSKSSKLSAEAQKQAAVTIPFGIDKPRLWNGQADPFMYKTRVSLYQGGQLLDQVEQNLGLRYFNVDADKGLFLNGAHLALRGVCRHQDRSEVGNALSKADHDEDMHIINEMGANAVRLSHYPHDPYFYDLLDKNGMVAWSEIPMIGPGGYRGVGYVAHPDFHENGKQQLIEMIRQNYNRPSVLFWGLFNELTMNGDNPIPYVKELNALAKAEDPTRLTTAASHINGDINAVTDVIAWNQYFGWYGGNPIDIGKWADEIRRKNPQFKIGLSEYGAGASIHHHEEPLRKADPGAYWHPEAWQAHFHEEHWKAISTRPFLWGSFIWNLFDFGASHRTEGERAGRNDKGLVTFDRKVKKDAWWFYKAAWNTKDPVLYIANRRFTNRTEAVTSVRVYSNLEGAELWVNGQSLGKQKPSNSTLVWNDVKLKPGTNRIQVKSSKGTHEVLDEVEWFLEQGTKLSAQ